MDKRFFRLPDTASSQARNAFRIGLIGLPASILAASVYLYLALTIGAWQLYTWSMDIWLLAMAVLISTILVRRERVSGGMWLLLIAIQATFLGAVALIEGTGLLLGISIIALVSIIAGQTLPSKEASRAIISGVISSIVAILLDLYLPAYRLPEPELIRIFLPGILSIVILLFGYVTIRQFHNFSLRTKLILSFVSISVIASWSVVFFADQAARTTLTNTIGSNLSVISTGQAVQVGQILQDELDKLNVLALTSAIQQRAEAATTADTLSPTQINALDTEWKAADAANNNSDPLVATVLNDSASSELLKFQKQFPENVEVFLTDLPGVSIATTDRTSDYLQSDEDWWQAAYKNGQYIGQPAFDASSKAVAINMAVVVRAPNSNRIVGVLRTTVNIGSLQNVLSAGLFGQTGQTTIYLPDGQEIKLVPAGSGKYELAMGKANIDIKALTTTSQKYQVASIDNVPSLVSLTSIFIPETNEGAVLVKNLDWYAVTHQDQSDALTPIVTETQNNLILAIVISVLAVLAALFVAQFLSGPILSLTAVAQKVTAGDINVQANVGSSDEIGVLARAFNEMTSRLRSTLANLEQRVTDRTRALATSTEVSRRLSTIINRKQLVTEVVTQVQEAFGYYHAQIYFFNDAKDQLVMAGGTGQAGEMMLAQFHKVAKGRGLVGRAAENNESILVSDTTKDSNWLPNPLLPDTKSEVAIPISIGNEALGVLDVQQDIVDGLQQEDVDSLQSIANQVAVALRNIQSTEIVAKRATELQTVATISTAAATISDVQKMLESVVHLTQRGFGLYHAHVFIYNENTETLDIVACGYKEGDEHEGTHGTAVIPLQQEQSLVARSARTRQAVIINDVHNEPGWLPNPLLPDTASELAVPMIVGNQVLGVLDVQSEHVNAFTDEDASIQTTLASQVATALQNARSFMDAQQQALHEATLNTINQKIQGTTTIESALQTAARELGHALGMRQTLVTLKPSALAGDDMNKASKESVK